MSVHNVPGLLQRCKKKDNTRIGEGGQLIKDGLVRMGSHDLCLVHYG